MHPIATLPQTCVELVWNQDVEGAPTTRVRQLRGALARAFADDDLFHQHDAEGKPLYRYPRIQYRWRNGHGVIVGWREAASRLLQLPWLDLPLRLGSDDLLVTDALLTTRHSVFAVSDRLRHYRLISPALLLNQDNYQRYQTLGELEQRNERNRLLVAQLLMALRGLQVDFPCQLYAAFTQVRPQSCPYKQQTFLGLSGGFVCNAVLPSGLAIGHAVSHGFGWVMAEEADDVGLP